MVDHASFRELMPEQNGFCIFNHNIGRPGYNKFTCLIDAVDIQRSVSAQTAGAEAIHGHITNDYTAIFSNGHVVGKSVEVESAVFDIDNSITGSKHGALIKILLRHHQC
ncbi:hypothetical protein SDC9_70767 [bioreactor metagenome]|uniref:Uncharacterized protein n=1 Tax=bioreactor metagenome TaxID=1076179 RepID=A0A644Y6U7_9ZZZZ